MIWENHLTNIPAPAHYLCMAGTIRTQQKCPKCGGKFWGPKSGALICPSCQTRPTRYYIDLWWHGERFSIFKTSLGFPLDSYAQAEQILSTIRHQISTGQFDAREWVPREIRQLEFAGYAQVWLERMQQEHISQGWLKQIERITRIFLIPHFGRLSIREIREGHIIDLNRSLPKHYRNKTRKNILNVLRRLLSEALVRRDIVVMPQFPRIEKQEAETKWLTQGEQERMREVSHLADVNPRELAFVAWARGWRCPKCGSPAKVFSLCIHCQVPENRFAIEVGVRF